MLRGVLVVCGVLGGGLPLLAQEAVPPGGQAGPAGEPREETVPAAEEAEESFAEVLVVTAALEGLAEAELPASVEVIDAAEIAARQATRVADLLATVAGLSVARSGAAGQVTSLFSRGTESDHTLVLWNGVQLNNPYFGGFNWAFLPTDGVDRVEVVRGPFSSLWGGDAVGGVVHIVSGETAAGGGGTLRLEAGEDGYARLGLAAGLRRGAARFDVAGHARRGDGRFDNEFFDGEGVVARAGWDVAEGMQLGLVARAGDSDTGIPFSGGLPSPDRRIGFRERELAVPFEAALGDWTVRARASRVTYDTEFRDPADAFGFTSSDTESEGLALRAVASWRRNESEWLAFGAESERLEVDDRSVFGVNLEGESQRTTALFGQWRRSFGRLALDLGLRQDDNDVYGSATSPRAALLVKLGAGTRLHASYGEGFRAPSIGELFFPFSGNAALEPETSESAELGIEHRRGGLELALTGFENRLENLIDFDFATFRNVNVGRARSRGVELEAAWSGRRVRLRWNATLLDTEDRDSGLELLRRPETSSNLVFTWSPPDWSFNLTARYVGERADVDPSTFVRARAAGFTTVDLAAERRLGERLSPYARVENLLDREYAEVLGFPAPRRTLVGGVAVRF